MSLLSAKDQQQVRKLFDGMTSPVKVVVFTDSSPEADCQYCEDTKAIVDEVASLSAKIEVETHDLKAESDLAKLYAVDRAPAIAIVRVSSDGKSTEDFGLRFYGIPSGYEFTTLLEDLVMVSTGETHLSATTRAWLGTLSKPLHLQVFVTPTCPYCPQMVSLAHKLAVASPQVTADGVEATEFPELSEKYGVYGVPRTVISADAGRDEHIEGAVPEAKLLATLQKAVGSKLIIASR